MTSLVIGCVLYGIAGLAMYDLPWYRNVLVVTTLIFGTILVRSSGLL